MKSITDKKGISTGIEMIMQYMKKMISYLFIEKG
jgi:hypothetical protein